MTELDQKNEYHIFITQWNHLNIFLMIEGIKTYRLLESGEEVKKIKHFISQPEVSFLAVNSLTSYFHLKSNTTMPLVSVKQNPNFKNFDVSEKA